MERLGKNGRRVKGEGSSGGKREVAEGRGK